MRALQQQYARLAADKASSEAAMEAAITAKSAELTRLAMALEASQLQVRPAVQAQPLQAATLRWQSALHQLQRLCFPACCGVPGIPCRILCP